MDLLAEQVKTHEVSCPVLTERREEKEAWSFCPVCGEKDQGEGWLLRHFLQCRTGDKAMMDIAKAILRVGDFAAAGRDWEDKAIVTLHKVRRMAK